MKERIAFRMWIAVLTVCGIVPVGCASTAHGPEAVNNRNAGYALLHPLADDDSSVGKLFIIKHASPKVVAEVKEVGKLFEDAHERLDSFKESDPTLNFDNSGLPEIEKKTRDAISSTYSKRLLFSSGRKFEVEVLQSQIRSLDYGAHLARMIAAQEDNKTRKDYLLHFADECDRHHKIIIDLLASL